MLLADPVQRVINELTELNPFRSKVDLPPIPLPLRRLPKGIGLAEQLVLIKQALDALGYNFLPKTFFCLEKDRTLRQILQTAVDILEAALPIRCLEATFVILFLTQTIREVERIPLSFKSRAKGRSYDHIVMVLYNRRSRTYGALGLSRKETLMHKAIEFPNLFSLIEEYRLQYEALDHRLLRARLGLYVSHDGTSLQKPCWRFIELKFKRKDISNEVSSSSSLCTESALHLSATHTELKRAPVSGCGEAAVQEGAALPPLSSDVTQSNSFSIRGINDLKLFFASYQELLPRISSEY